MREALPCCTLALLASLTNASWQCDALEKAGLGVLRPETEAYEAREESYFSVSAQISPYCIVQPTSTEETALALTTLEKSTCNFAVRGGGHMTWAGASNSELSPTVYWSMNVPCMC